jgi:hypothetical protein
MKSRSIKSVQVTIVLLVTWGGLLTEEKICDVVARILKQDPVKAASMH